MSEETQVSTHPLDQGEINTISSWQQWKRVWEETEVAELKHSLLHFGFQTRCEAAGDTHDRINFYLEAADGCLLAGHRFRGEDNTYAARRLRWCGKDESEPDVRRALAQKAYAVLAQNYFKSALDNLYTAGLLEDEVFDKVVWFFRRSERYGRNLLNVDRDRLNNNHVNKVVRDFASRFARLGWWIDSDERLSDQGRGFLASKQPVLILIMEGLGELDYLLKKRVLNEKCLRALQELAMNTELWLPKLNEHYGDSYRLPVSLEEACFGGSEAAKVLLLHGIKAKESARLRQVQALQRQKREAEQAIEQLSQ